MSGYASGTQSHSYFPPSHGSVPFSAAKGSSASDVASANSLAGVGIFFQQDAETNEVFVKTIVHGGSAERSGVIRVNDVVVRVDHESVEGQLLSSLRSRILGPQGSSVTLGFRRKEGLETTYYDVPLVRGSPEYFDSLKANQPLQDEIERLRRANSQLESQRARDAAELQRYRSHMEQQREEFDRKYLSMDEALSAKDQEVARLGGEVARLMAHRREAETIRGDLDQLKATYKDDHRLRDEKEAMRNQYVEELRKKHEEERARLESIVKRHEIEAAAARREKVDGELRESRLAEELKRRIEEERARKQHDSETRAKFEAERRRLQEAQRINETVANLLREMEPKVTSIESDLFVRDKVSFASASASQSGGYFAGSNRGSGLSGGSEPLRREDGSFFMA